MNALDIIKSKLDKESVRNLLISLGFKNPEPSYGQVRCCCEIHGGTNPSAFSYSLKNHMWFCFNCGAGGDVVQLIQDIRKLNFIEACTYMLHFVGITDIENINFSERPNRYQKDLDEFKSYVSRNKKENKLYTLTCAEPKRVTSFRQFSEETLKHFELNYINEMPFTKADGTSSVVKNRIGMPILFNNKVCGYALRRIKENDFPKWLFQPANLEKRNLIYNLELKWFEEIIICEGQFDVWAFSEAGLYATCVLGTSITEEQETLLTKVTINVTLCFDNDEAGTKATEKAIRKLKNKFNVYVVILPDGKDPCDLTQDELVLCYNNKVHHTNWRKQK